jgi:hypothetical protein
MHELIKKTLFCVSRIEQPENGRRTCHVPEAQIVKLAISCMCRVPAVCSMSHSFYPLDSLKADSTLFLILQIRKKVQRGKETCPILPSEQKMKPDWNTDI